MMFSNLCVLSAFVKFLCWVVTDGHWNETGGVTENRMVRESDIMPVYTRNSSCDFLQLSNHKLVDELSYCSRSKYSQLSLTHSLFTAGEERYNRNLLS